jgi:hypothetical protein
VTLHPAFTGHSVIVVVTLASGVQPVADVTQRVFVLSKNWRRSCASPIVHEPCASNCLSGCELKKHVRHKIVWHVGAVVIGLFVLGYFGLG